MSGYVCVGVLTPAKSLAEGDVGNSHYLHDVPGASEVLLLAGCHSSRPSPLVTVELGVWLVGRLIRLLEVGPTSVTWGCSPL